jgi:hypothetical protein
MARGTGFAFQIKNPPVGLTDSTRRALGQLDIGTEPILRLAAACRKLKFVVESPVYKSDCVAHVGIPKLMTAIYVRNHFETGRLSKARTLWEKHGWNMLAITTRQLDSMTDGDLVEQLRRALVQLGKVK